MRMIRSDVHRKRRGASILLIAFLLPVLIAMVVFSCVEVGRMYLVRSQLQTAVDAGALAAGLRLREKLADLRQRSRQESQRIRPEEPRRRGREGSQGGDHRHCRDMGFHDAYLHARHLVLPDAIEVSGTLDQEPFFFAKVFGLHTFAMPRSAIAIGGGSPLDIIMTLDLSGSMGSKANRSPAGCGPDLHQSSQRYRR